RGTEQGRPPARWYAGESHPPAPDLDTVPGRWRADVWPSPRSAELVVEIDGRDPYPVAPDVGLSAWNSCAGHLPYGQPTDQREDDARSLTWDRPVHDPVEIAGSPRLRLRVAASAPVATLSAKLCDVAPDGTSTLVTRGLLNLTRRDGMAQAAAMNPGEVYEVEVVLEATAWRWLPGQTLRLSLAGVDWPNTVAPPAPVVLTVHGGELVLPSYDPTGSPYDEPAFTPGSDAETDHGVTAWQLTRDVLTRVTGAHVDHGSSYDGPYGGVVERYQGAVSVDTRSWAQRAEAEVEFVLRFDDDGTGGEVKCTAGSTLLVTADAEAFHVEIELSCREGEREVASRSWRRSYPRDLA
ncbi:MAG TPA: CocE/NonD family hydrolase C-terminal non-catalytic domain-containing protein, partial [Candidatus Nanopelagicales bacterium]|nr:CocE/NonD family hydrolase C-terminal non-catalytic domain-containing protein [Candidatus Nanopelagicales bacterium]